VALLEGAGSVEVWDRDEIMPRQRLLAAVGDVEGLFCVLTEHVDAELLAAAPRLRVVSSMAVGVDNIDLGACTRRGIPVGHTPGVLAATVADTAIGLLLASARRIVEGADYVRAEQWTSWQPNLLMGRDLHHSTVGIVGLGGVGGEIAKRLRGFDCSVLAYNRSRDVERERALGVSWRPIDELLAAADHVVLAIALSDDTRHLIEARTLALMKPTATLVNVSRGGVVDQAALADALRNGTIASAALDVTDPEPIAADDPLLALTNCLIIPHLGSASGRTRASMAELAVRNLVLGLAEERMEACANPEVYER
jgi:lactate dehydrogenase-like 2-hydroxyacid dehydrogenase